MRVVLFFMRGFVSIRFICRALPLSFMGCVGLLCFVVPFLIYIYIYICIYMLFLFWRVVFVSVGLRCFVSLCVVWFRAVWICSVSVSCLFLVSLSLHRVVSCCVVSHRFGSF